MIYVECWIKKHFTFCLMICLLIITYFQFSTKIRIAYSHYWEFVLFYFKKVSFVHSLASFLSVHQMLPILPK